MWRNTFQRREWELLWHHVFSLEYTTCLMCAVCLLSSRCCQTGGAKPDQVSRVSMAFLLSLTPLVREHCRAYGQCVLGSRSDMQHLKLPPSPRQTGWRSTHMYADCLLYVHLPYIPWFQLTAADVSQLALRPNLNKGRLSQVGHMSSWRLQSLFCPHRDLQNSSVSVKYWCHLG